MKKKNKEKKIKLGPAVTRGEYLETCIKLTKRAINDPPHESDQAMIDQAAKLSKELKLWRKNEAKV